MYIKYTNNSQNPTNKSIRNGGKNRKIICTDISPREIHRWKISTQRCLTSLAIREIQIKTIMRYNYRLSEWVKLNIVIPNVGNNVEKLGYSYITGGNVK